MFLSLDILRNYLMLPSAITNQKIIDTLDILGHEVDYVFNVQNGNGKLTTGQIIEIYPHEKRSKINICKVNIGTKTLTILCGANNFKLNDKVVVAKIGTKLSNGVVINEREIGGIKSEGMLCSMAELGYHQKMIADLEGIIILEDDAIIGSSAFDYLDNDWYIKLTLTPNRGDCLSLLGLASDLAGFFNCRVKRLQNNHFVSENMIDNDITVNIETKNCLSYFNCLLSNVKVADSPLWLKEFLNKHNIRSINNVVDLTNFIMLETGVPLHAYDLNKTGKKFVIKDLEKTTPFVALDENKYQLKKGMTVIGHHDDIFALAAISGGLNTGVFNNTTNIVVEAANWNGTKLHQNQLELNLFTEAARRYYYHVDDNKLILALNRFLHLVHELKITSQISPLNKICYRNLTPKHLTLSVEKVKRVLGFFLETEEVINHLQRLGFFAIKSDIDLINVEVPTFRFDINDDHDLIEEILRLIDINTIKPLPLHVKIQNNQPSIFSRTKERIANFMMQNGFCEQLNYQLISQDVLKQVNLFNYPNLVKIENFASHKHNALRPSLFYTLILNYIYNYNYNKITSNAFEIDWIQTLNDQHLHFSFLYGEPVVDHYYAKNQAITYNDCQNFIFNLIHTLIDWKTNKMLFLEFIPCNISDFMHPFVQAKIILNDQEIGFIGQNNFYKQETKFDAIKRKYFFAELQLSKAIKIVHNLISEQQKVVNYDLINCTIHNYDFTFETLKDDNMMSQIVNFFKRQNSVYEVKPNKYFEIDEHKNALTVNVKFMVKKMQQDDILYFVKAVVNDCCHKLNIQLRGTLN